MKDVTIELKASGDDETTSYSQMKRLLVLFFYSPSWFLYINGFSVMI